MSDDRYPFGSDYPSAPPTYPKSELPSPVLPTAPSYPLSSYRPAEPFSAAYPVPYPVQGRHDPSIALTLVITLFFSLFGLIPAFIHTEEARRNGRPTSKYWVTFGVTLGAQMVLAVMFFLAVVFGLALFF